jgi:hypothetical protein
MSPGWSEQFEPSECFGLRGGAARVLATIARVRVRSDGGRSRKLVGEARMALVELEREFTKILASWGNSEGMLLL